LVDFLIFWPHNCTKDNMKRYHNKRCKADWHVVCLIGHGLIQNELRKFESDYRYFRENSSDNVYFENKEDATFFALKFG